MQTSCFIQQEYMRKPHGKHDPAQLKLFNEFYLMKRIVKRTDCGSWPEMNNLAYEQTYDPCKN